MLFDFVPSLIEFKTSFKIELAAVFVELEEFELSCFKRLFRVLLSASFKASFKTLLLFAKSIFSADPFEINILDHNIICFFRVDFIYSIKEIFLKNSLYFVSPSSLAFIAALGCSFN